MTNLLFLTLSNLSNFLALVVHKKDFLDSKGTQIERWVKLNLKIQQGEVS
jgi:hypothetical protein